MNKNISLIERYAAEYMAADKEDIQYIKDGDGNYTPYINGQEITKNMMIESGIIFHK